MKINIFRTSNQFSEEPVRIGVCGEFLAPRGTNDACLCKTDNKVLVSKQIAEVDFARHYIDCGKLHNQCLKFADKRTSNLNLELDCKCSCN